MFTTRLLSALVLIALVGGTVWLAPPLGAVALAAAVAAAGGVELALLIRAVGVGVSPLFVGATSAACCVMTALSFLPVSHVPDDGFLTLAIGVMIASGLVVLASVPPGPAAWSAAGVMLLAPFYVGVPLGTLAWIHGAHGPAAVTWLVAVIMVSDSAQYYVGTLFGRRPLAPVVSPKKTIEGALGGFVAAPVAGVLLGWWALPELSMWAVASLAIVLAFVGMTGDLFESLLKRSVGAKDSSQVIPGHGGILDRVDAYLFAAPVFYLFLRYVA